MHILLVDSRPLFRRIVRDFLIQARYHVHEAIDEQAIWATLRRGQVSVIIMSCPLEDIDGPDLLRRIRQADGAGYTYIILLAGPEDQEELIQGLRAGGDDYLVKPVNLKELRRRVILGARILKLEGRVRQLQHENEHLLTHDSVTGLLTRQAAFEQALAQFERCQREGAPFSLVRLEIDHLKTVNDRYGYQVGNQALRLVADSILRTVRQHDVVGRWGGAEFLLALPGAAPEAANMVADRLRVRIATLELTPPGSRSPLNLSISQGMTSGVPAASATLSTYIRQADEALAQAKPKS